MSQLRVPVAVAMAVVAACLIAAFMTAPTTRPGERTGSTIDTTAAEVQTKTGGSITRAQVLQRAQSWVDMKVPYDQEGSWPEKALGREWRTDCSGFVSMAWMLKASETTLSLPRLTTRIPTSELRPGDILNSSEHVVLFAGWIDRAKGTFTFYQESNKSRPTNKSTGSLQAAKLSNHPVSSYTALRYDHIAEDAPTPAPEPPTPARSTAAPAPSAAPARSAVPWTTPAPPAEPLPTPQPKSPAPVAPPKAGTPKPQPKPAPPPVVGGGLRTWVNAGTNLCLEIRRSLGHDGATANQWTCNNSSSQQWTTTSPGGWTTIVHRDSGKCLEIRGDAVADGATANQWTCNGSSTQSWRWQAQPGGGWSLVNANSRKCLTIRGEGDGALAVQQPCDGSPAQTWT
ncbi:RICIN domain-containing protein [Streptomyces sp. NPDC002033]|uniref:RICIN domain-containing protein n=1 Tax=unclassified Streptomyces TaxID=2593676 RepID=UPI00331AE9D6